MALIPFIYRITSGVYFLHFLLNGGKGEENNCEAPNPLLISKGRRSEMSSCWIFALTVGI